MGMAGGRCRMVSSYSIAIHDKEIRLGKDL